MSNKKKRKGYGLEHYLEQVFNDEGIKVKRMGQPNQPDLFFKEFGIGECKCRKSLKGIYDMKGDNNFLFLKWQSDKARNKPILALIELGEFITLLKLALKSIKSE